MRRRTFDALVSVGGLILTAILIVAGALLLWGANFSNSQVKSQLSEQQIVFPTKTNAEFKALPKADQAAMGKYAGQLMTTGAQAETYADHFIAYHLSLIDHGKTYSQLSTLSMAQPNNATLAGDVATVWKGTTLRSMLLEAYGFGKFGQIAGVSAVASFIGAALMLILSLGGLIHLRRTAPEKEVLSNLATKGVAEGSTQVQTA